MGYRGFPETFRLNLVGKVRLIVFANQIFSLCYNFEHQLREVKPIHINLLIGMPVYFNFNIQTLILIVDLDLDIANSVLKLCKSEGFKAFNKTNIV